MASLSNTKIKDTYQSLVKFSDNGNITIGAKQLTDGFGNNSPLYVSTTQIGIGITPQSDYGLHISNNVKIGGNLEVSGNLTVNGTLTYLNVVDLEVDDPLIQLAVNNSANILDIGLFGKYASSGTKYKGLFNDASDDKFKLFTGLTVKPLTTVNTSATGYTVATLVANLEGNVTGNADTSTKIASITNSNIVQLTTTQTLTNKTLTSPTITGTGAIAGAFTGDLTGNVTGNITGSVTGGTISGTTGTFSGDLSANNLSGTNTGDQTLPTDFVSKANGGTFGGNILISNNSNPSLRLLDTNNNANAIIYAGESEVVIGSYSTHPLKFVQNTGTALTIDTSKNATFVGSVTATGFSGPLTGNVTGGTISGTTGNFSDTITSTKNGIALQMDGGASAEGIRMKSDASTTYPTFLRSRNPTSGGETSSWIFMEHDTAWGIWHNNPINSFDFTRSSTTGIEQNVGGKTNTVMIRLNNTDGSGIFTGAVTAPTFTGNLTGNVTGNLTGNTYLNTIAYQGGEGTELDNSAFNVDGIGTTFRWIESNSGAAGTTWKKVADIVITNTITPNGVQIEAKVYQPNTNTGVTAGLNTLYYSIAFRGRIDDSSTHNDAIVYGQDANLLRVYKTADYTFELQARSNDNNRDLVVECNITSKKGGKVTPTTTYTNGTATGGTAYTASGNALNKTKFAGNVEFEGAIFDSAEVDDLRVNGYLYLGAGADSTYGGYLTNTGATAEGIMVVVDDVDAFTINAVTGNAGEQNTFFKVDDAVKLYDANGVVLETVLGGVDVTGTLDVTGLITNTYSGTSAHVLQNASSNGTVLQLNCTGDSSSLYLQGDHIYASGILVIGNEGTGANLYRATAHTFQNGTVTFDDDVYLNFAQNIYFARTAETGGDYSNIIGATNYPTGGYSQTNQNYWIKAQTKGGFHIVLNSDGTNTSAENAFDDFVIFQGVHDGTPRFRVSNVGTGYFSNKLGVATVGITPYGTMEVGKPLANDTQLTLSSLYSAGNGGPILNFRSGHGSNANVWNMGQIFVTDDSNYNGRIEFKTTTSGGNSGAAPTTKMTLKAAGNLGVGTVAPYERLVSDQAVAALGITQGNSSQGPATIIDFDGTHSRLMAVDWGSAYKDLKIQANTIDLQVGTGSTASALTIANNKSATFAGSVTAPSATITGITRTNEVFWGNAYANGKLTWDTNEAIVQAQSGMALKLQSNAATALTLDTSQNAFFAGNVKIGSLTTGTPAANADDLVIDKGASESGITIISTAASTLRFGDAANTSIGSIEYNHNLNYMRFSTNNAERMRIDSSGNATFTSTLSVNGNNVVGFNGSWNGANMPGSRFGGYSSNGGEVVFQSDNPSSGRMSMLVDGQYYAGENGGFYSLYSGNNYNNVKGFYADTSGVLQFNSSAVFESGTTTNILRFGPNARWGFSRANNDNRYVSFMRNQNATGTSVFTVDGDNGNMSIGAGTETNGTLLVGSVETSNVLTIGGRYNLGGGILNFRSGHPTASAVWNMAYIKVTDDGNFNGRIQFMTTNSAGNSGTLPTTKMTLKANGRLGIGTELPSELFHLSGGNARFEVDGDSNLYIKNAGTNAIQMVAGSGEELYIGPNDSYKLRFLTNGNIAMDNGGKLGIGISNPTCGTSGYASNTPFLHVYNDTNGTKPTINVSCHDGDEASLILCENSGGGARWGNRIYYEGSGDNFFNIETSDSGTVTHRMTIDRYGKVSFGTITAPLRFFDVRGIAMFNGPTSSSGGSYIYDGYVDSNSAYLHQPAFMIRQDSTRTGGIDEAPAGICIHNESGPNNSMTKLSFSSLESSSGGNTVTIAGIMARKTAGTPGNWASGELSLFTKSGSSYSEGMIMDSAGRSTFYYTSKHRKGIRLNRASGTDTGISWYNDTYYNWQNYMASAGTSGCGPNGNLTAPSGLTSVTSWALRSRMEGVSTYGWIWETGGSGGGGATASTKMELGATNGTLSLTGDVVAYASDKRLKTNVKNISNPIEKIKQINGVEYDWVDDIKEKYDFHPNNMHEVGVLAQEIEKVLPEAVLTAPMNAPYKEKTGEDHNFLTVKYERIVPLLIEAIKEQQKQIDELSKKICNCK